MATQRQRQVALFFTSKPQPTFVDSIDTVFVGYRSAKMIRWRKAWVHGSRGQVPPLPCGGRGARTVLAKQRARGEDLSVLPERSPFNHHFYLQSLSSYLSSSMPLGFSLSFSVPSGLCEMPCVRARMAAMSLAACSAASGLVCCKRVMMSFVRDALSDDVFGCWKPPLAFGVALEGSGVLTKLSRSCT